MIDVSKLTIKSAHESLKRGDYTVRELVDSYLKNIEEKNGELNAYLEVFDDIDEQVKEAQNKFDDGKESILTGIPFAVKDNILIKGKTASAASKMLENYVAPYDATVISKLKEHSPIFLGRTNMDEFAMGSSTETSAFGPTKNPHDISRVPGGSSGGSAVAVASKCSLVALGSDTGGSIRQPASFCGVVGMKSTYGVVSRYGLMAMGSSLDQIGPITNSVEDAEIVFEEISGIDPKDSTTIGTASSKDSKNLTVGIPKTLIEKEGVDKNVLDNFNSSVNLLKENGYKIKEIGLDKLSLALSIYYIIMPAEVSSNMARYDGIKFGSSEEGNYLIDGYFKTRAKFLGAEVRRRIMLGTYVLSSGYYDAFYGKANTARDQLRKEIENVFEEIDVFIMPTSPIPPFKIGEKINDPLSMYLADIFTVPANILGIPAISVPSGEMSVEGKNLPLGIQFFGSHGNEKFVFKIAKDFEKLLL